MLLFQDDPSLLSLTTASNPLHAPDRAGICFVCGARQSSPEATECYNCGCQSILESLAAAVPPGLPRTPDKDGKEPAKPLPQPPTQAGLRSSGRLSDLW